MSPDEFELIAKKIKPYSDYIYLHVLGEPLLHPQLKRILSIASAVGLQVNITSNGSLIGAKKEILLQQAVRQMNISMHDAEENLPAEKWSEYLNTVLNYAQEAAANTYISLRLWNSGVESSSNFNQVCINTISDFFVLTNSDFDLLNKNQNIKLADHIFLQQAPRFEWPDGEHTRTAESKTCFALRDQAAILSDGSVVPCCLDADGNMILGNIFTEEFGEILNSVRATKIRKGFMNHKITEEFCKSCGFFI
jgi:radical SAM protein with 4Fe4S-binding SPASM domain